MARLMKSEKGFTLVEVLIALALLGLIATAFSIAIFTATKAIIVADERTTAESIARSQLEYAKEQEYEYADGDEVIYLEIDISAEYPNYSIWSVNRNEEVVEDIIGVPWDSENDIAEPNDIGLQKIELIIKHDGKEVLTLEGYKVDEGVY